MRVHFTSDTHFGHSNIIKYCTRPFRSAAEMDSAMIENWNQRVEPTDVVWIIGDFSFADPQRTEEILCYLNGIKKIVLGNHDKTIRKHPNIKRHFAEVHEGFVEEYLHDDHTPKNFFVMCHYPMMSWNRSFRGAYHLHGHTHGNLKFDPKWRRLDVGVDVQADYAPVSLQSVVNKLSKINIDQTVQY